MLNLKNERTLWWVLGSILLLRLVGLGIYPLMDTSEARYAEMARKMVELNDWITPMFDYGVPFWGKPPLSFWTQAASMTVFGVNEFAARFPAWLLHLASCIIIIKLGTQQISRNAGIWAAIIFSSTTLGLVSSGVVLTDPVLSFSILLASYGFWRWMKCASKADAYLMFAGLGLGLLAKGPLTLVLMGAPAFAWFVIYKEWGRVLRLPWISGLVLMFGISVPWYVAAEMKTPGFMEYFFVGEHWSRYVVSNWAGDLYGSAHAKPYGSIWIQLGLSLLPWALFLPLLIRKRGSMQRFKAYLWLWALATPVFFTFAGNILWTYLLPALPAWALLLSARVSEVGPKTTWAAAASALVLPIIGAGIIYAGVLEERPQNQRDVVQAWLNVQSAHSAPLIYPGRRSYSSEFYSSGKSENIKDPAKWPRDGSFYLSRRLRDSKDGLPADLACTSITEANASQLLLCHWKRPAQGAEGLAGESNAETPRKNEG